MFRKSVSFFRYRTAWRELLHVLPVAARHDQWLKRDTVEVNEAILRQPYYVIKSYIQPSYVNRRNTFASNVFHTVDDAEGLPQGSNYVMQQQLRAARYAMSPKRLQELRDQLQFPNAVGPLPVPEGLSSEMNYVHDYGVHLRPRYPESWDTVPPHQPSRIIP